MRRRTNIRILTARYRGAPLVGAAAAGAALGTAAAYGAYAAPPCDYYPYPPCY